VTTIEADPASSVLPANAAERLRATIAPFLRFFTGAYSELEGDPSVANLAVGNPHDVAMPSYVDALRRNLEPRNKDWFAYKMSEPEPRAVVAGTMSSITGLDWDPEDVQMTNGGFAALALAFRLLLEPDDEAIFLSPPWFFYEHLIVAARGKPVRVSFDLPDCPIDVDRIARAITPRTRLVVVNSPHNPSGRILSVDELRSIADVLSAASEKQGRPIYLVSDEPYRRIVFDGNEFHSPAEFYPNTVVAYSYGKQLLAPGMRIGYLTWPPTMPDRERLRDDAFIHQMAMGWAFPNALLQHSLADLEPQCIDLGVMEQRRERLLTALREQGYRTTWPDSTFYALIKSPIDDDEAFCRVLNDNKVLVLPGTIVEAPGWFRISLTASDQMIEQAIPAFGAALKSV
jgi:aspartate aminotransferase